MNTDEIKHDSPLDADYSNAHVEQTKPTKDDFMDTDELEDSLFSAGGSDAEVEQTMPTAPSIFTDVDDNWLEEAEYTDAYVGQDRPGELDDRVVYLSKFGDGQRLQVFDAAYGTDSSESDSPQIRLGHETTVQRENRTTVRIRTVQSRPQATVEEGKSVDLRPDVRAGILTVLYVKDVHGNMVRVIALIDTGAETSLMKQALATRLGLTGTPQTGYLLDARGEILANRGDLVQVDIRHGKKIRDVIPMDIVQGLNHDIIIGEPDLGKLAIYVSGLQFNSMPLEEAMREADQEDVPPQPKSQDGKDWLKLPASTRKLITANGELSGKGIAHPAADMDLEPPDGLPERMFTPQYRIRDIYKPIIQQQVEDWLAEGVVEDAADYSAEEYNSPLLCVAQTGPRGTKYRVCLDVRRLNTYLSKDKGVKIPVISTILESLRSKKVFTHLDLQGGYHQIPVKEEWRKFLAFSDTNRKKLVFAKHPFGLSNLTQKFQLMMETILKDHLDYVRIYVDDVIICSDDHASHALHVDRVLETLNEAQVKLRLEKSVWHSEELRVLGHIVRHNVLSIDPYKQEELVVLERPTTKKELWSFLGRFNFIRDYIPNYAIMANPLHKLTGGRKTAKSAPLEWLPEHQEAYEALCKSVSIPTELHAVDPKLQLYLSTDASITGCGATLWQEKQDGSRSIISLFSKAFNQPQRNYANWKREFLGVKLALEAFDHYVYGRHVIVQTDCKSLLQHWSEKQTRTTIRWHLAMARYDCTWTHVEGITNIIPDALSRLYEHKAKDYLEELRDVMIAHIPVGPTVAPRKQHEAEHMQTAIDTARQQEPVDAYGQSDLTPSQGTGAGSEQPESESEWSDSVTYKETRNTAIIRQVHLKLGPHAGVRAVIRKMKELDFIWPNMPEEVQMVVAGCITCAQRHPIKYRHGPYTPQLTNRVWERLHVDLGELPKDKLKNKFFLVVTDHFSGYIIAAALKNKEAPNVRACLTIIFSALGIPLGLKSDNGTEFIATSTTEWLDKLGITHTLSLPYHKQGNGAAENAVKRVKRALRLLQVEDPEAPWSTMLLATTTCLNNMPIQGSNLTPSEILHNRKQTVVDTWEHKLRAEFQARVVSSSSSDRNSLSSQKLWAAQARAAQVQGSAMQEVTHRWHRHATKQRAATTARFKDKQRSRAQRGLTRIQDFKVGQCVISGGYSQRPRPDPLSFTI
jgi:transposase InsO family protein